MGTNNKTYRDPWRTCSFRRIWAPLVSCRGSSRFRWTIGRHSTHLHMIAALHWRPSCRNIAGGRRCQFRKSRKKTSVRNRVSLQAEDPYWLWINCIRNQYCFVDQVFVDGYRSRLVLWVHPRHSCRARRRRHNWRRFRTGTCDWTDHFLIITETKFFNFD